MKVTELYILNRIVILDEYFSVLAEPGLLYFVEIGRMRGQP